MNKNYIRIIFKPDEESADSISSELFALGCEGIEEKSGNEHVAYFKADKITAAEQHLQSLKIPFNKIAVENKDWHLEWKKNLKPVQLTENYWATPPWIVNKIPIEKAILIEPKMAFGTGHHETTKMCAGFIEQLSESAKTMLDVGTGSGLLAIIGEKRGLTNITAFDNDPSIFENIAENISQNHCEKIHPFIGTMDSIRTDEKFDIISANIISSVLIPIFPLFRTHMHNKSRLILSGLLVSEKDAIKAALGINNLFPFCERELGEWYAVVAGKK